MLSLCIPSNTRLHSWYRTTKPRDPHLSVLIGGLPRNSHLYRGRHYAVTYFTAIYLAHTPTHWFTLKPSGLPYPEKGREKGDNQFPEFPPIHPSDPSSSQWETPERNPVSQLPISDAQLPLSSNSITSLTFPVELGKGVSAYWWGISGDNVYERDTQYIPPFQCGYCVSRGILRYWFSVVGPSLSD